MRVPRRLVAVGLTVMGPGFGQVGFNRIRSGLFFFAATLVGLLALFQIIAMVSGSIGWMALLLGMLAMIGLRIWDSVLAFRAAKEIESVPAMLLNKRVGLLVGMSIVACLILWSARAWLVEPYVIPSASMAPTLLPKDRIYVAKRFPLHADAPLKRGSLVVYRSPEAPHLI